MSSLTISRGGERCLWAALIFCTVYDSYRYPLQINSSLTSPTYIDTPVVFQLIKYLVTLLLCIFAFTFVPSRHLPFRKWILAAVILSLSLFEVGKALTVQSGEMTPYFDIAFWPIAALVLALASSPISMKSLDKFFRFLFLYALLSDAVQVILFLTVHRLPALAYSDSISVRFGGFLDDPNGFAVLLYLLMGWSYHHFEGKRRVIAEVALLICLVLTQSLTALAFLALFTLFLAIRMIFIRPKPLLVIGMGMVLGLIYVLVWKPISELVTTAIAFRSGSVDEHLGQITSASVSGSDALLGGSFYKPYESWWVGSVVNFGIPWYLVTLIVVGVLCFSAWKVYRAAQNATEKAVTLGILLLCSYFTVGCVNLPLFAVFPVNFLFFFFPLMFSFNKIQKAAHGSSAHPILRSSP
jgi:hypothetical protein